MSLNYANKINPMITLFFKTIRTQLLVFFLLFSGITILLALLCFKIYKEQERSSEIRNTVQHLSAQTNLLIESQLQFMIYESKNSDYYLSGESDYIKKHNTLLVKINNELNELQKTSDDSIKNDIIKLKEELKEYSNDYHELITKIYKRGHRDRGLEGDMRKYIHDVEIYKENVDMVLLLTIRRNEKDYILRKDTLYLEKHRQNMNLLKASIEQNEDLSEQGKSQIINLLNEYNDCFNDWVALDSVIGTDQGNGLTKKIKEHNENIEKHLALITSYIENQNKILSRNLYVVLISAIALSVLLSILLSILFSVYLTKPIIKLSGSINEMVSDNFSTPVLLPHHTSENEIGKLISNLGKMQNRIHTYVSEIKNNENIILEREKKFRAMIENSSDAIALIDAHGNIIYSSHSTFKIFGFNYTDLNSKNIFNIIFEEDIEKAKALLNEVISHPKQVFNIQLRVYFKDNQWHWIDANFSNLIDEPYINSIIINYRDITSRKTSELKIEEQYSELQKINNELDKFVYSASHDLKAPLTSMLGLIHVARMESNGSVESPYFEMIEGSIKKLLNVIKDLTTFSRNSRTELLKSRINFNKIIADTLFLYSHLKNYSKINFILSIDQEINYQSDPTRLTTLFHNLISNAIIYHNPNQDDCYIKISISKKCSGIEVLIEDNGSGIEYVYQPKIFDMFFRASSDSEGSGLGLYIVKDVVEKLKGKITLYSEPGKGTTFIIWVPEYVGIDADIEKKEVVYLI